MIDAGATVAIIEGNSILLTLREDFEVWCMPGGGIEPDESLADAARREVREETGLEVELTRLVGVYSRVGWRPHHVFLFVAHIVGGMLQPDPHEVLEARFFPLDALPEHMEMAQHVRIADAISGVTGVVKTEYVPLTETHAISRAEIYALRDQSGLTRREFYQRNIPPLTADKITVEVSAVHKGTP